MPFYRPEESKKLLLRKAAGERLTRNEEEELERRVTYHREMSRNYSVLEGLVAIVVFVMIIWLLVHHR